MTSALPNPPAGFHAVTPSLTILGAGQAIEFYKAAFGAEERYRISGGDGKVMHAEITIGGSIIMISDEFPDWNSLSPPTIGGTASTLMIYVDDVDQVTDRAVAAGATILHPLSDQFWGDRTSTITDPFGHRWSLATPIELVSPEEIKRRVASWTTDNQ